jgi:hypothetical protein
MVDEVPDMTADERPRRLGQLRRAVRWLVLLPLPPHGTRLIDLVILPIGIVVALCVCIPILIVWAIVVLLLGTVLTSLGVSPSVMGYLAIALFVVALAVCFVMLLRVLRRLPGPLRRLLVGAEDPREAGG